MEKEMEGLNLEDEDEEDAGILLLIDREAQKSTYEFCLVGWFLTTSISFSGYEKYYGKYFASIKGSTDLGFGRKEGFFFKFFHEMDIKRVMERGSWTFNNHMLIHHRLENNEDPMQVPLVFSPLWVHVHDLPPSFFSKSVAKQLGNFCWTFCRIRCETSE
ncbi:hypothetical protein Gotri_018778 [Gossypium trilobum]|uniref:DUF4283 domain-containing protein n=1 Tax=Gossypium trilobum TaxID=34281 RepID=A0A7J9EBF7_9ROSI|nr:hypothetical protein [Gossypium trilobum]